MTTYMRQNPDTGVFEKTEREQIVSNYLAEDAGWWSGMVARWLLF